MTWKNKFSATAVVGVVVSSTIVAAALAGAVPAHAEPGNLTAGSVSSAAVGGTIDYTVYLPEGYDPNGAAQYATLYLLHGRGDTQAAWQQVAGDLDELIAAGTIPPMIVVMPDAPWSNRGSYYVDSQYTGSDPATMPGAQVETAFTTDLVDHIDANYRTIDDRAARAVGGYSMGGAGAVRYVTAHQDLFSAGIALSPAVYAPTTPVDSSTREFGAYGVGDVLYDEERYQSLNYPAGFAGFDAAQPVHLFIAVGDDEYANPKPEDAVHDLDYEAATLYNQAKRVPGITAELRVYNGGHDWGVWKQGFREGVTDIAAYLQTTPPTPFTGAQFGSAGDDRAGGLVGRSDGSVVQAVNAADSMLEHTGQGGFDILIQSLDPTGTQKWVTSISTALNERAYGVVDAGNGAVVTAGYVRQSHAAGDNDDGLVAKLGADGTELWRSTFGSESAADRFYGVVGDGDGGAFVTGYTSGSIPGGSSAGDKDAIIAHIDASGAVAWATQVGSAGEDKGFAVAASPDGGVYAAGVAGGVMPGATTAGDPGAGSPDGWVAKFGADGTPEWLSQVGSSETDQVSALVATASGVAATGFTGGVLGAAEAGGIDAFVMALAADGTTEWITQDGSSGDDRGASIVTDAAGGLLATGHTSGRIAGGSGGVDVFTLTLDVAGSVLERSQFGSAARDGADEYDEANLYSAGGDGSTWIQGLTMGNVSGAQNAGGGDVFLTKAAFDAVPGDAAGGAGDDGGADPGAGGAGAAVPSPGAGGLSMTGADAARWAALATLLLMAGGMLLLGRARRRRRTTWMA